MKKIFLMAIFLIFTLNACRKELPTYKDGDRVIIDNIVYEFDDYRENEFRPYNAKFSDNIIYHSAYYLDMIHPEKYEEITKDSMASNELFKIENGNSINYAYFPLDLDVNEYARCYKGFYVIGIDNSLRNDSLIDVTIPGSIDGYLVLSIGYKAFAYANIQTVQISDYKSDIYMAIEPFAFENISNLKEFSSEASLVIFPRAFENLELDIFRTNNSLILQSASIYNSVINKLEIANLFAFQDYQVKVYPPFYETKINSFKIKINSVPDSTRYGTSFMISNNNIYYLSQSQSNNYNLFSNILEGNTFELYLDYGGAIYSYHYDLSRSINSLYMFENYKCVSFINQEEFKKQIKYLYTKR